MNSKKKKKQNVISSYEFRMDLYHSENERCHYCGCELCEDNFHVDHVIPKSRGGDNSYRNLTLSCRKCNCIKGSMTPEEFAVKIMVKRNKALRELLYCQQVLSKSLGQYVEF